MNEMLKKYIDECSQMERFNLVTRLGNDILINGGEIFRANEAMQCAARTLRLDHFSAYVIANGIFSTVIIDGRFHSSKISYVPLAPTMLCRVEALNELSRKIADGLCGPYEIRCELDRIERMQTAGKRAQILASGFGSASFCYLFRGSFFDAGTAFLAGVFLYLFLIYGAPRISVSRIMRNILASGLVALFCCAAHELGLGDNLDRIMIGAIFPMVPGIPLTNSIRNFMENDYLSGLIRLVDAFLTAGSIAIGVGVAMRLWLSMMGGML